MILIRRTGLLGATFALAWLAGCGGSSGGGSGSGRNAYVAVPQGNAIAAFRVDSSGDLTRVLGSPFAGGTSPAAIAVHPSGKFVYAANQGGNDVSMFTINSNTGELNEVMPRTPAGSESVVVGHGLRRRFDLCGQQDLEYDLGLFRQFERWYSYRSCRIAIPHRRPAGSAGPGSFGQIPVRRQRKSSAGIRLFRGCGDGQPAGGPEFSLFGRQWTKFPGGGSLGNLPLRNQLQR